MENQAVGLAEALALDIEVKSIRPNPILRALPTFADFGIPATTGGDPLEPPWPDVVITCGRRHAGASIGVKKMSEGKCFTIHIQDPRIAPTNFNVVVSPEHDRLRGKNVLLSLGSLNRLNPDRMALEAERITPLITDLPRPLVMVAIGGTSKRHKVTQDEMAGFANNLAEFAEVHGCGLLVTTSRRTPTDGIRALRECLDETPAMIWTGDGLNPYFGFLELASAIIVTSDSANMVCEAASTGRPVYLAQLEKDAGKFKTLFDRLTARDIVRPFNGNLESWQYEPLRETERIASKIRPVLVKRGIV